MSANPHSDADARRLDRLVADYADRLARDEDPQRDSVLAAYPHLRAELEECFDMIEAGAAPPAFSPLAPGSVLGDFRILRELGRGGMGVVYLAEQQSLQREVALKVLVTPAAAGTPPVHRFLREARAGGRIEHPNVVRVHAVGEATGRHYIAMEPVTGPTLASVVAALAPMRRELARAGWPAAPLARASGNAELAAAASHAQAAVMLLLPAVRAVAAAHHAGIVHRDLKPANVLLDRAGQPHVADFGLALVACDPRLSRSGEVLGTPHYMAPEQARAAGGAVDARCDVFSLGITLYELLTLRRPFEGDSEHEVVTRILQQDPHRPSDLVAAVPASLDAVVLRALAKDPAQRYPDAGAFADDLDRVLRRGQVAAAGVGGLSGVVAAWLRARMARQPFEYRSRRRLLGLPLLHIAHDVHDPVSGRLQVACGLLAGGNVAIGLYAFGGLCIGVLCLGWISIGVIALGLVAIGVAATGGIAAGYEGAEGLLVIGPRRSGLQELLSGQPQDVVIATLTAPLVLGLVGSAMARLTTHSAADLRWLTRRAWLLALMTAIPGLLALARLIPVWACWLLLLASVVAAGVMLGRGMQRVRRRANARR